MSRKHRKIVSDEKRSHLINHKYLSKKMAEDLIYMYEREPEWEEEVEELIDEMIYNLKAREENYDGYKLVQIDMYFPVKCGDVCVDYDYIGLLTRYVDSIAIMTNSNTCTIIDISYIVCTLVGDNGKPIICHYVKYKNDDQIAPSNSLFYITNNES